jgi:hypothetical protein
MQSEGVLAAVGIALSAATMIAGCGSPDRDVSPAVRDSAGIRIIENHQPAWSTDEAWRLADRPMVDIGGFTEDPNYELFRVNDALRLDDGRIVVANGGSAEMRFYDARGQYLQAVGREGAGPGEFEWLQYVSRYGRDSLLAWDSRLRRANVYDLEATFHRSSLLSNQDYFALLLLPDGSLFGREMGMMQAGEEIPTGIRRLRWVHARFGIADSTEFHPFGEFPETELYTDFEDEHMHMGAVAFGARTVYAATDSMVWIGTADAFAIDGYTLDGRLAVRIRAPDIGPDPITAEDKAAWVDDQVGDRDLMGGSGMGEHMRAFYERMPHREYPAPYDRLLADRGGRVWVQHTRRPHESRHTWTVFDPGGQWLGNIAMPGGFSPFDVGNDYVLGVWRDDLEIEHVQLYSLNKPAQAT